MFLRGDLSCSWNLVHEHRLQVKAYSFSLCMQLLTAKRTFPVTMKYEAACELRVQERERLTLEYRRRFGSTAKIHYPAKYQRLPPFAE
jgi:hypothetical protein